ncbi:hypothetical protein [Sulfobacillus harzensis]|uniref:Peptidase C1A papain C-terminal domain-containing protein n=1 Tax=Sulfobacillus harzensis TaxID=2729629 RepID=A0A7Y0L0N8_9FIRM|nr:hypothetical protein [Sulfobacillus harzensis]NMP20797.1 hypothetical protein [Sulfobacillus harzensis]
MPHYTLPLRAHQPNPFERRFADVHSVRSRDALPASVNLAADLGPVRNQNVPGLGECSAESGAGIMDWLMRHDRHEAFFGSSLGLYEIERALVDQLTQDAGARLRQTQYAMQTVGVWANALDPDVRQDFVVQPTPAMLASAAQHRIREGLWCPTLDEILNALAHPQTPTVVQVGIVVYPSFEAPETMRTALVPLPEPGMHPLGGHAVIAFGYSMHDEHLYIRNSWGPCYEATIGDSSHANFALPFAYFDTPRTFLSARAYYL